MSFGQAIATCYKKFFTFSGRASRREYWWFLLFAFLVVMGILVLAIIVEANIVPTYESNGFEALDGFLLVLILGVFVAFIGLGIPMLAVGVRRLHDRGLSGWWIGAVIGLQILSLLVAVSSDNGMATNEVIDSVGGLISLGIFFMSVLPSQPLDNKYGPMPLNVAQAPVYQGEVPPPPPSGYMPL